MDCNCVESGWGVYIREVHVKSLVSETIFSFSEAIHLSLAFFLPPRLYLLSGPGPTIMESVGCVRSSAFVAR